jgi:hypothetical protein
MPRWPAVAVLVLMTAGLPPGAAAEGALTAYVGRFSDNEWEDYFLSPGAIEYREAWIAAVAGSWQVARLSRHFTLEAEAGLGGYGGDQHHWEVNAAVAVRYRLNRPGAPVRASMAFGIGPSWASRDPRLEKRIAEDDTTQRAMVFWYLEADAAHRSWGPWSAVMRLHHRSGAYGVVAPEGGSNVPSLGLRRRF